MRTSALMACAGGVAAVAVTAVLLWPHGGSGPSLPPRAGANSAPEGTGAQALTFTPQDATALSTALASGIPEQVRRAVLIPAAQPVPPEFTRSLQAMGKLTFDLASFVASEPGMATVTATSTPTGAAQQRWTVYLAHGPSGWRLAATQSR
jgi:hypothetical protein